MIGYREAPPSKHNDDRCPPGHFTVEQYVRRLLRTGKLHEEPRNAGERLFYITYNLRKALSSPKINQHRSKARIALSDAAYLATEGDVEALQACKTVAAEMIEKQYALPEPLALLVANVLRSNKPPKPRKRGRVAVDEWRNILIASVVLAVSEAAGIPIARSPASRDLDRGRSACSVMARILPEFGIHMSEGSIEKLWYRTRKTDGFKKYGLSVSE